MDHAAAHGHPPAAAPSASGLRPLPANVLRGWRGLQYCAVFFFSACQKVSSKSKPLPRVLVISREQIYVCLDNGEVKRCIRVANVRRIFISASGSCGNLALLSDGEHGLWLTFSDPHKARQAAAVLLGLQRDAGNPLPAESRELHPGERLGQDPYKLDLERQSGYRIHVDAETEEISEVHRSPRRAISVPDPPSASDLPIGVMPLRRPSAGQGGLQAEWQPPSPAEGRRLSQVQFPPPAPPTVPSLALGSQRKARIAQTVSPRDEPDAQSPPQGMELAVAASGPMRGGEESSHSSGEDVTPRPRGDSSRTDLGVLRLAAPPDGARPREAVVLLSAAQQAALSEVGAREVSVTLSVEPSWREQQLRTSVPPVRRRCPLYTRVPPAAACAAEAAQGAVAPEAAVFADSNLQRERAPSDGPGAPLRSALRRQTLSERSSRPGPLAEARRP